jgi:hypothetical protein
MNVNLKTKQNISKSLIIGLSILFTVISLLLITTKSIAIEETVTINGVVYTYDKNEEIYIVSGWKTNIPKSLTLESQINGTAVTKISNEALFECTNLESITIPNNITSIGMSAFYSCTNLKYVDLPNNISKISFETFADCGSLISVEIPDSVIDIETRAFFYCDGLINISIPNGVKNIGATTFAFCQSLRSIKLPDGLENIGISAFYRSFNLLSISIPDSVNEIGATAFEYCNSITVYCNEFSYAHSYAIENNIKYNFAQMPIPSIPPIIKPTDTPTTIEPIITLPPEPTAEVSIEPITTLPSEEPKIEVPINNTKQNMNTSSKPKTEKPTIPKKFKVKKYTYSSVKLTWKKVWNAKGYEVYRSTKKKGRFKKVKNTNKSSYINRGLKINNKYYYKVRAYNIIRDKKIRGKYTSVKSARL